MMTADGWLRALAANEDVIRSNRGPSAVAVVCGLERDRDFWLTRLHALRCELFRADGEVALSSSVERVPRGNFLGTIDAWTPMKRIIDRDATSLMVMAFGQGKRLSPFTQALGNRKPAMPTPASTNLSGIYLNAAELAMRHTALPIATMNDGNFRGVLVKWGDEAFLPDVIWGSLPAGRFDAVRFVARTEPTETTAREKEWLLIDRHTQEVVAEIPRQPLETLMPVLRGARDAGFDAAVNLGSLAASYSLLDVLESVFPADATHSSMDWDPFVWMALLAPTAGDWEKSCHASAGAQNTLAAFTERVPDIHERALEVRRRLRGETGAELRVVALDLGTPLWVDLGLHPALRRNLLHVVAPGAEGLVMRRMFGIADDRDANGNTMLRSFVSPTARVRNSVIIDSRIGDGSAVTESLVIGSRVEHLNARLAAILFCEARAITATGEDAISFAWHGEHLQLSSGDRVTLVRTPNGLAEMRSRESLTRYDAETFEMPVFGNAFSFADASRFASELGPAYDEDVRTRKG